MNTNTSEQQTVAPLSLDPNSESNWRGYAVKIKN